MIVRFRALILAALTVAAMAAPAAAQTKVAFVDTRKILQEMPSRNQIEARLRTEIDALGSREKVMVDSLNAMLNSFQKDSATLSQADRTKRFTEMQAFDARYRDTLEVLQQEAQAKQAEAMQPLFDQIREALEMVRAAEGYAMIFDMGAQANPVVAMDKNLDLSDKVIARIRTMPQARPAAQPTRPPAAAPATRPPASGPTGQPAGVRRP
ncbi:MAG: OmpH family outer membrane protein [Gemmatimonadota bacterium]|jgi:outer membrane protein